MDDEASVRGLIRRLLTSVGYDTRDVGSGQEALEVARSEQVDLVVTDMKMPGMNGIEVSRTLLEENPDLTVLLVTAYADLNSAREAVTAGIYEYFTKPFDTSDMLNSIRRGLDHRKLAKKNEAYKDGLEQKVAERRSELKKA